MMKPRKAAYLATTSLIFLSSMMAGPATFPQKATPAIQPATIIKVGVTEYSKSQATLDNYVRLFRELAASSDPSKPVTFTFALGTYGEVRDWYDKGVIDVGILSAMPVGELLLAGESRNLAEAYVGDLSVNSAPSPDSIAKLALNPASNSDPDAAFKYRPVCIGLRSDKELEAIANDDNPLPRLQKLWNDGQLKFLFVRPYSLSGYIVPMTVLRKNGIDPLNPNNPPNQRNKIEFTYEHFKSLERLVKSQKDTPDKKPQHVVAFVLDDARFALTKEYGAPEQVFRRIPFPLLDNFTIPREVVVANYHQTNEEVAGQENKFTRTRALMSHLLDTWKQRDDSHGFTRPEDAAVIKYRRPREDWQGNYQDVTKMLDEFSLPRESLQKATLDDLLNDLISSKSPRLAVVLSGGGAKCAYQAGAIVGIEEKLRNKLKERAAELKNELSSSGKSEAEIQQAISELSKKLDISLVVGTSGGAINALLVAMGVTKHADAENQLRMAWQGFNQQQFLRPSRRFRVLFGLGFGILQALAVAVAVLLFGRQTMHWPFTIVTLLVLGAIQLAAALYFHLSLSGIVWLFSVETLILLIIIAAVIAVDLLLRRWFRRRRAKSPSNVSAGDTPETLQSEALERESKHWRRLTIVLLLIIGVVEALFAITPRVERVIELLPYNHWLEHAWTAAILTSKWSYPYPLLVAIIMALIGWKVFSDFDWNRWREPLVLWTGVLVFCLGAFVVFDALFHGNSVSKVDGIEEAVVARMPELIRQTVEANFTAPEGTLQSLSNEIMNDGLLKRDLIITSSKLPTAEIDQELLVNRLPDDLYFYYSSNHLKPPPSPNFISLKYNPDKLLDIVIGSTTIYPIFPSRDLKSVVLGPDVDLGAEETHRKTINTMRVIDGGYIHNIPIGAAQDWRATHIIVIEASPSRPQRVDPKDLWDHLLTAFGYLFDQAQRTDMLAQGQGASAFILRPTSECEKLNARPVCTDDPDPNLDTFDFSETAARDAFRKGLADVLDPNPLFVRVTGAPRWVEPQLNTSPAALTARSPLNDRQNNLRRVLR